MLHAYFDGSGQSNDPDTRVLILGCVAGIGDACETLRDRWKLLLKRRAASLIHMKEATQLRGAFEGCTRADVEPLLQGAIGLLTEATHGQSPLVAFACAVNMDAYRAIADQEQGLASPEMLCSFHTLNDVYEWYRANYQGKISRGDVELTFDQGELFRGYLESVRSHGEFRKHHRRWQYVQPIKTADAREEPLLQAADMLAWSSRRILASGVSDWQGGLAHDLYKTAKIATRVFAGNELRRAARSLAGQNKRYRRGN